MIFSQSVEKFNDRISSYDDLLRTGYIDIDEYSNLFQESVEIMWMEICEIEELVRKPKNKDVGINEILKYGFLNGIPRKELHI